MHFQNRANLNDVMKTATRKNQIEGLIVYALREVVLYSMWDEEKGDYERVRPGETFKVHTVDAWPEENDGEGCVSVMFYDDVVEDEKWAHSFEVRY